MLKCFIGERRDRGLSMIWRKWKHLCNIWSNIHFNWKLGILWLLRVNIQHFNTVTFYLPLDTSPLWDITRNMNVYLETVSINNESEESVFLENIFKRRNNRTCKVFQIIPHSDYQTRLIAFTSRKVVHIFSFMFSYKSK